MQGPWPGYTISYMKSLLRPFNTFPLEELLSKKVYISYRVKLELGLIITMLLVLIYTIIFSYVTILRHYSFRTTGWDLGIFMQILWNTIHGTPFYYTYELLKVPSGNFLALHFAPIIILLVPLYALMPRAETLLVFQSFILGLGAIPLYLLTTKVLNSRVAALGVATAYLLYPPLHGVNWFDFHVEAFIPFLIISLYYSIEYRRIRLIYLFTILALMTITFTPIIIATIMICSLIESRKDPKLRKHLLILLIFSITYFYLAIKVSDLLASSNITRSFELQLWAKWGNSLYDIILNVLTHPLEALVVMFTPFTKPLYLVVLLSPLLFLPIFAPLRFIPALAWIIPALLSDSPPFGLYLSIYQQYPGFVIGQLFVATIYGAKQLVGNEKVVKRVIGGVALLTLLFSVFMSPLGMAGLVATYIGDSFLSYPVITQHDKYLSHILTLVPQNASILTQNNILPHVSNRMYVFGNELPNGIIPDYILVDIISKWATAPIIATIPVPITDLANHLLNKYDYGLLACADGIFLFKLNYSGPPLFYVPYTTKYDYKSFAIKGGSVISIKNGKKIEKILIHKPTDDNDVFFYGPYVPLGPGTYEVSYTLKVEGIIKPEEKIIDLDVVANKGQIKFAERSVYGLDVPASGLWFNITITFSLDRFYSDVEFRGLHVRDNLTVYLREVVLTQISCKHEQFKS